MGFEGGAEFIQQLGLQGLAVFQLVDEGVVLAEQLFFRFFTQVQGQGVGLGDGFIEILTALQ